MSKETHAFRFRVTQAFLQSGTPLSRLKFFRPVIERADVRLTDESNMAATYIPHIEKREFEELKRELKGQFLGLAFDGTSRLGEAVNLTGRMCTENFEIVMRLLRFVTAKLHLNAAEFSSIITRVICSELGLYPENVVCISRDSVLVNGAACRLLRQGAFCWAENQLCIAHTLNNTGSRLDFPLLKEFFTPWLELVGGRHPHRGAQDLWRSAVHPQKVPGYSAVRWHATAEIQFVLADHFDKLAPFMRQLNERGYGDATRRKLNTILDDADQSGELALQLAAIKDLRIFVSTTYELEGDRLELLLVYDRVESLRALGRSIKAGAQGVLPNVDAVLRHRTKLEKGTVIEKVCARACTPRAVSSACACIRSLPRATVLRRRRPLRSTSRELSPGGLHSLHRCEAESVQGALQY